MNTTYFSIVTTVYNKQDYILNTINSVLQQTIPEFEIIVVNDGSTDLSLQTINNIKDKRINVYTTKNQGAAAARNYGIEKAKYDYIAFIDGDDIWEPYFLEEICKLKTSFPHAEVFSTSSLKKKKNITIKPVYSFKNPENKNHLFLDYFTSSYIEPILHSSSCVIKKSVFKKINYFDPTIKCGQDTDLWIRIGLNYKIAFSTKICATYNINNDNSLDKSANQIEDKLKLQKFEHLEKNSPSLKKYLDLNRFSLVIFCKINGYKIESEELIKKIDIKNLNLKQRFLLHRNRWIIKKFYFIKQALERINITASVFN